MTDSIRDVLAREAAEAEARADAEERGDVEPTRGQRGRRPAADPSQVYAVRIPVSRLQELRQVADELGMPPTALIRQWVIERLDQAHVERGADLNDPPSSTRGPSIPFRPGEVRLGRRRSEMTNVAGPHAEQERRRA